MMMEIHPNTVNLCPKPNRKTLSEHNITIMDGELCNNNYTDSSVNGSTEKLKKCEWSGDNTYPSTDCLECSQENTSATSLSREDSQHKLEDSPINYIPTIVSFESPIRRRDNRDSSFLNESDESDDDICHTDVDFELDTSRDGTQSIQQPMLPQKSDAGVCIIKDVTPTAQSFTPGHSEAKGGWNKFTRFRLQYLTVHTAIMLADGLQGTHLYVLYEGYGYSVSSLYSLGFVSGALTSPFIGPVVDKIGRKRAAMIYCFLEIIINYFEQFPIFAGLLLSRILGGITTNLLFSVFESWLVTEHRQRGFEEEKLEIILRDSTIVSNSAAIISGYLAHNLAENFGPVGPFEGAVVLTALALTLVGLMWTENYGKKSTTDQLVTFRGNMVGAYRTIAGSTNISRIGIIQGLTEGSLQTFVFLWAPALRAYATSAPEGSLGLGKDGEPAYGLIFGSFMAFGVVGGFLEPTVRKAVNSVLTWGSHGEHAKSTEDNHGEVNPISVHFLCAMCYLISSILLLTPCVLSVENQYAFSLSFAAFLMYELMIGLYMPCEGVVRSIYMPNESICSLMTMLRVIVNITVALGVISTNFIPFTYAFGVLSIMMVTSACLQLSLVPRNEFRSLFGLQESLKKIQ